MPIYEYRCTACGHELEKLQRMSDAPLVDCPACGQPALNKKISAAGFRLKGGGWYETDFKKDKKKNLAADGDAKPASDSKSDSKPDSKSDSAKTDSKSASKPSADKAA